VNRDAQRDISSDLILSIQRADGDIVLCTNYRFWRNESGDRCTGHHHGTWADQCTWIHYTAGAQVAIVANHSPKPAATGYEGSPLYLNGYECVIKSQVGQYSTCSNAYIVADDRVSNEIEMGNGNIPQNYGPRDLACMANFGVITND